MSQGGGSRRGMLVALAVIALLVLAGLYLSKTLGGAGAMQDCVAAGRTNCAPLATPTP